MSSLRWQERKRGPHCTEAGLRLGSVAARVTLPPGLAGADGARVPALVARR